jgi:hypothetical protein
MGISTLFRLTFGDEWEDKDSAFVVLADLILWSKNKVRCLLDAVSLTLQDKFWLVFASTTVECW